ncbi:MAG: apolipoprotein N-acyltransferase [Acidimicrobiales bacterium]
MTDLDVDPAGTAPGRPTTVAVPVWLRCVAAGLALVAAVPPWGWWPLGIVGVALLDGVIADQPWRARFGRTWLVCAVWLSIGMVWMWDMTPPGYLVAFALYAAYFGLAVALTPPGRGRLVALPGAVALAEATRWAFPFGGVPLATIPHGQVAGPLAEVVRVAGPVLLVMVTVVAGQALASAWRRQHRAAGIGTAVVVAAVLVAVVAPRAAVTESLDIAIVQGGGEQRTRDSPGTRPLVFQRHLDATELVDDGVELIVWPENVVHVGRESFTDSDQRRRLSEVARERDVTLVVGVVETADDGRFYNAAVVIDPDGEIVDRYDKVRRVPFGEVTPFRGLLERIAGDTIVGNDAVPGTGPALLDTPVGPMSTAISWEVFFAGRVREGVERGGEVVLNPTNGSSYWLTIVQSQQIASSRLRALESDRWVLQAAPTGFSAVVSPEGEVLQRTGVSEQAVLHATVERRSGQTLAIRLGDRPPIGLAVALVVAGWVVADGRAARALRSRRAA